MEKQCKLNFCNNPVKNWRTQFCCRTHASQYSAFSRYNKIPTPKKTLAEIEKTKRPKLSGWEHRGYYPRDFVGPRLPTTYKFKTPSQKGRWISYVRARQKKIKQATPNWVNKNILAEIYIKAQELTVATNIKHEVDHIIPISHPLVCGLHVPANLQILTKLDNRNKTNKFIV